MKYDAFEEAVRVDLADDAEIAGDEAALKRRIASAALEIIAYVPQLRPDSTITVHPNQVIQEEDSCASLVSFPQPDFTRLLEVYTIDQESAPHAANANRSGPYNSIEWGERYALLNGQRNHRERLYCMHPDGRFFYLFPALPEDRLLVLHYETWEPELLPNSVIRFPQKAVEAAACYCRARIRSDVDSDDVGFRRNDSRYRALMKIVASTLRHQ